MDGADPEEWPGQHGFDPIQCPHCDEVTTPNLLSDGSYICSCTAERALPLAAAHGTPWDGVELVMPAPVDDGSFMSFGPHGGVVLTGEHHIASDEEKRARSKTRPEDRGQFGRDIATEDFKPLCDPTAERPCWRSSGAPWRSGPDDGVEHAEEASHAGDDGDHLRPAARGELPVVRLDGRVPADG
jgi:hypothetical protein